MQVRVKTIAVAVIACVCLTFGGQLLAQDQAEAKREAYLKDLSEVEVDMVMRGMAARTSSSPEDFNAKMKGQPDPTPKYAALLAKGVDDPTLTLALIANRARSYHEVKDAERTLVEMSFVQTAQNARIIQLLKQQAAAKK